MDAGAGAGSIDALALEQFRINMMEGRNPSLSELLQIEIALGPGLNLPGLEDDTPTISELLLSAQNWDEATVERLQNLLFEAGMMPDEVYSGDYDLRERELDQATQIGLTRLISRSLTSGNRLDQTLFTETAAFDPVNALSESSTRPGQVGGGGTHVIQSSDPATVEKQALAAAQQVLGHDVSDIEKQAIVAAIRAAQINQGTAEAAARESQGRTEFGARVTSAEAQASVSAGLAATGAPSSLPNPVAGGVPGGGVGEQRTGHLHQGLDISAKAGTAIIAPISGVVRNVKHGGNSTMGGNSMWIEGADGRAYYFAHMQNINVENGQSISVGGALGTVGNTGTEAQHTGAHLHFSINAAVGTERAIADPMLEITGKPSPKGGGISGYQGASSEDVYVPGVNVQQVTIDGQARAEEAIEKAHPVEAEAYDILGAYNQFRNLFGGASTPTRSQLT